MCHTGNCEEGTSLRKWESQLDNIERYRYNDTIMMAHMFVTAFMR